MIQGCGCNVGGARERPVRLRQGATWSRSFFFASRVPGYPGVPATPLTCLNLTGATVRLQGRACRDSRAPLVLDLSTTSGEIVLASGVVPGTTPPGAPEPPNGFTITIPPAESLGIPDDLDGWYDCFADVVTPGAATKLLLYGPLLGWSTVTRSA